MTTYKYTLCGLDCAHCAAKIEQSVASLEKVQGAHVDFVTKTLSIQTEEENITAVSASAQQKIHSIESNVQMIAEENEPQIQQEEEARERGERLGTILAAALFVLGFISEKINGFPLWLPAILMGAAALIAGYNVFLSGFKSLVKFRFDENALMSIAVIAAFCLGEFNEAAMVALLFRIGEVFEEKAVNKSRRSIEQLAQIRPDTAWLVTDRGEQKVSAKEIAIGSRISVHPFERIPLDGMIQSGNSTLDSSALTGESLPIEAAAGTEVLSGMMNGGGLLIVETQKLYADSAASRIIDMVESAAAKKGNAERTITKFARIYTPIVMVLAVLLAAVPPLLGLGAFTDWLYRALVFLVASCPCALVISVPLGYYAGIGAASKIGVLVKGGRYVEALSKVNAVVFDKTGTLTSGKLSVTNVFSAGNFAKDEIVSLAAAAEQYSDHPAAKAIKNAAASLQKLPELTDFSELAGLGVRAKYGDDEILCGRKLLFSGKNISTDGLPDTSVYLAKNGVIIGAIEIADTLREDTVETIRNLKKLGIQRLVMLTGDAQATAEKMAQKCELSEFHAGLMPEDKVDIMQKIRAQSGRTAFVGDGINDAPVLAAADCGVAMGLGTDAAIESADVVLTTDNPAKLPAAIRLFRRTMSIIHFNIVFALVIKAAVLILAAVGIAPMWLAVFADVGVSVLSVINATRILKTKAA